MFLKHNNTLLEWAFAKHTTFFTEILYFGNHNPMVWGKMTTHIPLHSWRCAKKISIMANGGKQYGRPSLATLVPTGIENTSTARAPFTQYWEMKGRGVPLGIRCVLEGEAMRSIEKGPNCFHTCKKALLRRRRSSNTGVLVSGSARLSPEGIHLSLSST